MISPDQLARFEHVRDVLGQPDALDETLGALETFQPPEKIASGLSGGRIRRVVLTGMGASFHALYPLHLKLTALGLTAILVETSELIHYQQRLLQPDSLLIAVSQSGRSVEILRLLETARGRGPLIGVTNSPGSPLRERCDYAVITQAGTESSVSTKTYVATLAALEWLGEALGGGDLSAALSRLRTAVPGMRSYLRDWQEHVTALTAYLAPVRHVFLTGRGVSLATACEGGLVLKEAAHFPAEGMGCAAFRHGPLDMAEPGILVCVFAGDEKTAEVNRGLARDVEAAGGLAAWIGPDAGEAVFRIAAAAPEARPLLEILPVQMISLALAARAGREPGRFARLGKVTTVE